MKIDTDEVHRIAALAQLELTGEEAMRLSADLSSILDYVDQLKSQAVDEVAPAEVPAAPLREDTSNRRDVSFAEENAPAFRDGLFVVPRVIGE